MSVEKDAQSSLTITSSGLLQIDTDLIRERVPDLLKQGEVISGVKSQLSLVANQIDNAGFNSADFWMLRNRAIAISESIDHSRIALEQLALAYEMLELKQQIELMMQDGNYVQALVLSRSLIELRAANPVAAQLDVEFDPNAPSQAINPKDLASSTQILATAAVLTVLKKYGVDVGAIIKKHGVLPRGHKAIGELPKVGAAIKSLKTYTDRADIERHSPKNFSDIARGIPDGSQAQIKVIKYTDADGEEVFQVDIAGTDFSNIEGPFGAADNLPLYLGAASESYAAVISALQDAGAEPGTGAKVHFNGHSQGAMIASNLASSGLYDTQTVTTFGPPVSAELPSHITVAEIAHEDDLVNRLAGSNHAHSLGSEDSIRVRANYTGSNTPGIDAHHMSSYVETAAELDSSGDPRVEKYQEKLRQHQSSAVEIQVMEFTANSAETPAQE